MYIYIYACVCVCVCVCVHICIYIYIYVCSYVYPGVERGCQYGAIPQRLSCPAQMRAPFPLVLCASSQVFTYIQYAYVHICI